MNDNNCKKYVHKHIWYTYYTVQCIFDEGSIDRFDAKLAITQKFLFQQFPLVKLIQDNLLVNTLPIKFSIFWQKLHYMYLLVIADTMLWGK